MGWEVAEAASGAEVLTLARRNDPDVVLLDLSLTDGAELAVLSELKQAAETSWIPVVVRSAAIKSAGAGELLRAGAQDHIAGPCPMDELEARLLAARRVAVEHRQWMACENRYQRLAGETVRHKSDVPPTIPQPKGPYSRVIGGDHSGHVLVAEDNLVNQRTAVAVLKGAGYHVEVVASGTAAVTATAAQSFDAILMDCHMPGMDGYEATAAIRAHEGTSRHTPIIAMTAGARREDRDRCMAEGMDSYIPKPIGKVDLLAVVARSIDTGSATMNLHERVLTGGAQRTAR
jgi:CheY-like chemotaxis protein